MPVYSTLYIYIYIYIKLSFVNLQETYSNSTVGIIDGGGPLSKLQAQVNEVKDVMTQNIEKVLERGERLEDLVDKTEDLEASVSRIFVGCISRMCS